MKTYVAFDVDSTCVTLPNNLFPMAHSYF